MFKSKKVSVGLDIGDSGIKVVALQEDAKQQYKLLKYAIKPYASDAENHARSIDTVVNTIKQAYREAKIDEKKVRVALSGSNIVVRYLTMPKMSLEEVKQNIRFEGDQHIPFSINEVEIDCDIIKNGDESGAKMEVILAAVRKEACQHVMDILDKCGLTPVIIDVDSIAIMNAFNHAHISDSQEPIALLNIGSSHSEINILHQGVPVFTRILNVGGNELTIAIAKGLGIDHSRAEELKMFGDIIVKPFAEAVLQKMARDIRSSFDYYEGMSGLDVGSLYISGGGSLYDDYRTYLGNSLGLETSFWDPFEAIDIGAFKSDMEFLSLSRMFSVGVGLAIRKVVAQ